MVVTTGVSTSREKASGRKSKLVVDQVELARPLEDMGDVQASHTLASMRRVLRIGARGNAARACPR